VQKTLYFDQPSLHNNNHTARTRIHHSKIQQARGTVPCKIENVINGTKASLSNMHTSEILGQQIAKPTEGARNYPMALGSVRLDASGATHHQSPFLAQEITHHHQEQAESVLLGLASPRLTSLLWLLVALLILAGGLTWTLPLPVVAQHRPSVAAETHQQQAAQRVLNLLPGFAPLATELPHE
jgi:hypothetical protein